MARWDWTAAQFASRYRKTPLMEGFYLEMPWPAASPSHSDLHLFIRYVTDDGRKLQIEPRPHRPRRPPGGAMVGRHTAPSRTQRTRHFGRPGI